jgi:hypothetical protein
LERRRMAGMDVLSMSGLVASVSWVRVHLSGMRRYTLDVGKGWVSDKGVRRMRGKKTRHTPCFLPLYYSKKERRAWGGGGYG